MGYVVELYFDRDAEERILRLWDVYTECNITSLLPSIGSRPHISLAVFNDVAPDILTEVVAAFAQQTGPLEAGLAAVASFPGPEGVLFLVPTVSRKLVELHEHFHRRLEAAGLQAHPYYRPGRWVPHCTIASDLTGDEMKTAFELARESQVFGSAKLISIGIVRFRPVVHLASYPLSGS